MVEWGERVKHMAKISLPKPLFAEKGKRAVLLLHAYSGSPNDVRMLSRSLEVKGYTVYSPMFAGHGTMEPADILQEQAQTWWQETQDSLRFLKEHGYQEIAVFGLSMGGIFATKLLTLNDPAVIGGGFFCSPIAPVADNVLESFQDYAEKVYERRAFSQTQIKSALAAIKKRQVSQLKEIKEQSSQTFARLETISCPVFLAQAGQDEMIDPTGVFLTAHKLKQTRVTLQWYPDSAHVITVGTSRRQLEQDIAAFLASLSWHGE